MYKKLMLGTVLMTNLNALPAVQRIVPRVASSVRTLATRTSALAPQVLQPAVRLAASNNLSRIVANQEQSKSNWRTYLALAGLAAAAGVNEVAKCDEAADDRLYDAIWNSNVKGVRRALENGANVNVADKYGSTPLHNVAFLDKVGVLQVLLERADINVNVADNHGNTPLHIATRWDRVEVVRALLKRSDINVNAVDNHGWTPLREAVFGSRVGIVRLLLERADINVNAASNDGNTPLHMAARWDSVEVAQELLKMPDIDVNAASNYGSTPLYTAASLGRVAVVRELLKRSDINVNAADNDGWTPLHIAASSGRVEVVRTLLERSDIKITSVRELCFIRKHKEAIGADLVALAESKASKMVRLLAYFR